MMGTKTKSRQSLERAVARYETKLATAPNPTRRQYASTMLRMAKDALEHCGEGKPAGQADCADIVDLHKDEYAEL